MDDKSIYADSKIIRRKIQIVGGNTVTISLPRTWADKNNIGKEYNKQKEINMRYHPDGSLILTPADSNLLHSERIREYKLRKNTGLEKIKRMIVADFIGGIDTIRFRMKEPMDGPKLRKIKSFVSQRLIGFSLVEYNNLIEIINMTQAPQFGIGRLLEIIRVQSKKMIDNCYHWLFDEIDTTSLIEEMNDLENTLDRHANQMMRTLQLTVFDFWMREKVNLPPGEILYWSAVTKHTENVADLAMAIVETSTLVDEKKLDKKLRKDLYNLGNKSRDIFNKALKAFIMQNNEDAHSVLQDARQNSIRIQQRWPIENTPTLDPTIALIMRHMEKISTYSRKIAEATLNCESARIAYNVSK